MDFVRRYNKYIIFFLVTLGVIIPALLLHLGFYPWKDEEYELLCMADYRANPLSGLTMFVGYLWTHLIGTDSFLSYRILAYVINTLSVVIPVVYFYYKTRRGLVAAWMFIILQFVMSLYGSMAYEWDTMSNFLMSVTCVGAFCYFDRPSRLRVLLLGLMTACCVFARIPNLTVVIVFVALILVVKMSLRQKLIDIALYMLSLLVCSYVLCLIIWGGLSGYAASWAPDNIIDGHNSFYTLIQYQFILYYEVVIFLFLSWIGLFAVFYSASKYGRSGRVKYIAYALICVILLSILISRRHTTQSNHNYYIELFYICLILLPVYAYVKGEKIYRPLVSSLILIGFLLAMTAASDCAIYKMPCTTLFPFILICAYEQGLTTLRRFLFLVSLCIVVSFPYLRLKHFYSREWIFRYKAKFEGIDKLEGINASDAYVEYVNKIYNWAKTEEDSGKKILFIGPKRYMFDYILNHNTDRGDRYPVQLYHDDVDYLNFNPALLDDMLPDFDYIHFSFLLQRSDIEDLKNVFAEKGFVLQSTERESTIFKRS